MAIDRDAKGGLKCPVCGGPVKPMIGKMTGKGFNCAKSGWDNASKRFIQPCGNGSVIWNKTTYVARKATARPQEWVSATMERLNIRRTNEQITLKNSFAVAPGQSYRDANGKICVSTRLKIEDAGAGCGKTSSNADNCETIFNRVGAGRLLWWWNVAFNTNATQSIEEKIPAVWANICSINAFGNRHQPDKAKMVDKKISQLFREAVKDIPYDERPSAAGIKSFCDRMRDSLLMYAEGTDTQTWNDAITAIADRFPALRKLMDKNKDTEATIRAYVPQIMVSAHFHRHEIDFTEQYTRPITDAIVKTGWRMRLECLDKGHVWTDDDLEHLCKLIRAVQIEPKAGVIVDEAQDLSPSQIVLFLAATYRSGELTLVGDDKTVDENGETIKVGQAIFAWRGAFPGSLTLIEKLWGKLTGEKATRFPLSVSFRCPPEHCDALRPMNKLMVSSKPRGNGPIFSVGPDQAFTAWIAADETKKALWLTRKNAPAAGILLATLKERKKCAIRGGPDMGNAITAALYDHAGMPDADGEYIPSLKAAMESLEVEVLQDAEPGAPVVADDMASFLLEIGKEILRDASILKEAELSPVATVGNLVRFVKYFADRSAPRIISTVYRAKGDEAELVIVGDCESFNQSWNGDDDEAAACRFVACSRSKHTLLVVGSIAGLDIPATGGGQVVASPPVVKQVRQPIPGTEIEPEAVEPVKVKRVRKAKTVQPLDLFAE